MERWEQDLRDSLDNAVRENSRLRSELERVMGESASNADHARIASANFRAMDKARAINLARAEAAEARIAGLGAENAKLRNALRVFGDIAEDCDEEWGDVFDFSEDDRVWVVQAYGPQMAELSIDDFRTARAALQPISPEGR